MLMNRSPLHVHRQYQLTSISHGLAMEELSIGPTHSQQLVVPVD